MRRERAIDIGIALGVFALTVATLASGGVANDPDARSLDALGVVLAALASLPLLARRTAPLAAFAAAATASAAINALNYPPGPPIGPMVALFFVGLYGDRSKEGGRLIAAGTPEQIVQVADSHTGRYLRDVLATGRSNAYGAR